MSSREEARIWEFCEFCGIVGWRAKSLTEPQILTAELRQLRCATATLVTATGTFYDSLPYKSASRKYWTGIRAILSTYLTTRKQKEERLQRWRCHLRPRVCPRWSNRRRACLRFNLDNSLRPNRSKKSSEELEKKRRNMACPCRNTSSDSRHKRCSNTKCRCECSRCRCNSNSNSSNKEERCKAHRRDRDRLSSRCKVSHKRSRFQSTLEHHRSPRPSQSRNSSRLRTSSHARVNSITKGKSCSRSRELFAH